MQRRTLLKSLGALGSLLAGAGALPLAAVAADPVPGILKPPRLRPGMTVGLIAPASPPDEKEAIRFAMDVIRSLGFEVKAGKHLYEKTQYLAGSDEQRAEDVNSMFADPAVDAIFCLTGGYGTTRILPYIDYDAVRSNPKVVIGYSDITGLLLGLYARAGLVGFHGPVAQRNFGDYALAEYKKVLVEPRAPVQIAAPPPFETREGWVERDNRISIYHPGKASGPLLGGNLSLVAAVMGTPYEPSFEGAILFLEDVHEAPYRIDRMLTQLWLAGRLQQLAGVALGRFTDAGTDGNTFSLEEVFEQRLGGLGIPVVRGFMIGHMADIATVPMGVRAELDGDAGTLTLLETAVR
jgi:muramoyltetrapeptide carboxypeptidase